MFCPECNAEYREGFSRCSDCHVDLVEQLPPGQEEEFIEYIEILRTSNPSDIALIKSILDSEGIIYYFQGEHANNILPPILPARLKVNKTQEKEAVEILKDLNLSTKAVDLYGQTGDE
ncbi:MAG: DUF2007 domain-containing protein [Nitrospirota bacterium]